MRSIKRNDMSNDLDGPLSRFSRHFYLEYLKYRAFYGLHAVSIEH